MTDIREPCKIADRLNCHFYTWESCEIVAIMINKIARDSQIYPISILIFVLIILRFYDIISYMSFFTH